MQKEYTISQAVNKYGTQKQKQSFELKVVKGDKNLNKNVLNSILKVIETRYEEVKVEGRGSKRIIICNREREIPLIKQDNRKTNGKQTVPYTDNLDFIIIKTIKEGIYSENPKTLINWCYHFGLINSKQLGLLRSKFDSYRYDSIIKDLVQSSILQVGEQKVVDDFYSYLLMIKDQAYRSLVRLQKINALNISIIFNGKTSGKKKSIIISEHTYNKVKKLEDDLKKQFSVENINLFAHPKAYKVIAYKDALAYSMKDIKDEDGTVLNLEYVFPTYELNALPNKELLSVLFKEYPNKAPKLEIVDEQNFWQENYESYLKNRKKYINSLAEKKIRKFFEEKYHGPAYPELFGKGRKRGPQLRDFNYDIPYYTLFFDDDYSLRISRLSNYFITE